MDIRSSMRQPSNKPNRPGRIRQIRQREQALMYIQFYSEYLLHNQLNDKRIEILLPEKAKKNIKCSIDQIFGKLIDLFTFGNTSFFFLSLFSLFIFYLRLIFVVFWIYCSYVSNSCYISSSLIFLCFRSFTIVMNSFFVFRSYY